MIQFPPTRVGLDGSEPVQTSGDGFTHHARADGASWAYLNHWSEAVARMVDDTRVPRILVSEHWSDATLDALLPHAAYVEDLAIGARAVRDFSALAAMPALRRLELHHSSVGVSFAKLYQLRECVIVGPAGLGSVREAPALVHLTLDDLPLKDLHALEGMDTLRSLTVSNRKTMRLDGIETLSLERVKLRLRGLASIAPLVNMRLRSIALHEARVATDIADLGAIRTLESIELEGVAPPRSLDFVGGLRSLVRLLITETALSAEVVSVRALADLAALRELELLGGQKSLGNLADLDALGALHTLERIHVHRGPKEIDTIRWVGELRELTAFRLQGTRIRDGDLTPLLRLPRLRDVTINPVAKHYSHSPTLFHIEMEGHVQQSERDGERTW